MLDAYRTQYGFNGIHLLPVNLYGPGDNFDAQSSHVIPALIRKFQEAVDAKSDVVTCWGSGKVSREFLFVEDAAEGIAKAAEAYNDTQPINLGTGQEITIADLAKQIAELCGYQGTIKWDTNRPDGQPRRQLDTTRAATHLDWQAKVDLPDGLRQTIAWWRSQNER
jgi:GDP-L-fucose synthase